MNVYEVRKMLQHKPITDIPLRVVSYCRVSTKSAEQATSIENQVEHYRKKIQSIPAWTFVGEYVDNGISGTSVKARVQFNRMVEDAQTGKFDLIVTKAVSRFARNTLDSLMFSRKLLEVGVGIWFDTDGILNLDKDGELRLSIFSALAQDESAKKSESVKFGLHEAIKKGTVFGFDNMFGYRKKDGKLMINEKEAPAIRKLFELYATDQYSMKQIEQILYNDGFRNHNGNKLSHATMAHIIRNPKYKGYFCGNKVTVEDMFSKKMVFKPETEWVMFKDESIVPAIVSEELWEKANAVLAVRSLDVKQRQNKCNRPNLMTGKLYCEHCGRLYHRKMSKTNAGVANSSWVCAGKIEHGAASCPSRYIYESELKTVLYETFRGDRFNVEECVDLYVEAFQTLISNNETGRQIEAAKKEMEALEKKRSKLLEYNVMGSITDQDFLAMNESISSELEEKKIRIASLESELERENNIAGKVEEIRESLLKLSGIDSPEMITEEFIKYCIDRIDVKVEGDVLRLTISLVTGKSAIRQLAALRPGQRSLVM